MLWNEFLLSVIRSHFGYSNFGPCLIHIHFVFTLNAEVCLLQTYMTLPLQAFHDWSSLLGSNAVQTKSAGLLILLEVVLKHTG